ncbi:MAG: DUF5989 family protein [Caldilineaceae bacterium]
MIKFFSGLLTNLGTLDELMRFLNERKLWWMMPMVAILLVFGLLLLFTSSSGVAPFIYTLF